MLFPVWLLQNLLMSVGLESVLSQTEITCIASNCRQYSANIYQINTSLVVNQDFSTTGLTKLVLIL